MKNRTLGGSLTVSAQGLGCMGMSDNYGSFQGADAEATLRRALDLGINFFDTADVYGPHTNERLIGEVLRNRRDDVVIATKFGHVREGVGPITYVDGRPDYVRAACDASLLRLGIDEIDLYYQHRVDRAVPVEETWGAMKGLVDAGKVRYLGISEAAPDTIRRAHAVHQVTAVQSEYSLWTRDVEDNGVLDVVRELGIGFVPFSPLGRGFLTGSLRTLEALDPDDLRRSQPRFQSGALTANLRAVEDFTKLASERGVTPGQLAIAWVLAQGDTIVPIPGTKHVPYLEENVAAASIELNADDLLLIESIVPKGSFQGDRYADMSTVHI